MPTRYLVNWGIWIGVLVGIYLYIYLQTPLAKYSVIWMTFVAVPIYFTDGAKPADYLNYVMSMVAGLLWGLFYLYGIAWLIGQGMAVDLSIGLAVGLICCVQCAIHFIPPLANTPFRVVPVMFGATAMLFSQANAEWVVSMEKFFAVGLTFLGGLTLAVFCGLGTRFLTPEGRWTLPGK